MLTLITKITQGALVLSGMIMLLHQILQPETLALRSNDLCFYTSDGAFIWKDCKLYANRPFVVWLEFILL